MSIPQKLKIFLCGKTFKISKCVFKRSIKSELLRESPSNSGVILLFEI